MLGGSSNFQSIIKMKIKNLKKFLFEKIGKEEKSLKNSWLKINLVCLFDFFLCIFRVDSIIPIPIPE